MSHAKELHDDLRSLVGTMIGERYRVDAVLGVGGMGAVFRGHHVGLRRDVAIKVLHPEIGRDAATSKRFDREARSASRLDHDNCVRVTDYGSTTTGTKYLVMELLEGIELKTSLGIPMVPGRAVELAIQMFNGLDHAHHHGIVHRDLKPENVFLTHDFRGDELVKIVDFGIAKIVDAEGSQERLTRTGLVFGTPSYMSPEQASGDTVDHRADLYAAGLILYEMLAGRPPFFADTTAELMRMQLMSPPPPLPQEIPHQLAGIVERLLEKNPGKRQEGAREVVDALVAILPALDGLPPAPAPVGVTLAASESATAATTAAHGGGALDPVTRQTGGVSASTAADSFAGASQSGSQGGDDRPSRPGTRPTPVGVGHGRADTSRPSVRLTAGPAAHTSASGSVVEPVAEKPRRSRGLVVVLLGIIGLVGVAGAYLLITFGPEWLTGVADAGADTSLPNPDDLDPSDLGEAVALEPVANDDPSDSDGDPEEGEEPSTEASAGAREEAGSGNGSMLGPLINPFGVLGGQTHEDVLRPSGPDPENRPSFPSFGTKSGTKGSPAEPAPNAPDPAPGGPGGSTDPAPSPGPGSSEDPGSKGDAGEENAPKGDPAPSTGGAGSGEPPPSENEGKGKSGKKNGKKPKKPKKPNNGKKPKKSEKEDEKSGPPGGPQ